MKPGEIWYNPNGYFSLKVLSVNGKEVTLGSNDPRDFDRTLKISDVQDWILLKGV